MKTFTIIVYNDPGHGWGKVKRQVLSNLGLADKVSAYSYQYKDNVYLEEDCDLGLLYSTCDALGITIDLKPKHTNNRSPIRSYATYRAENVTC